MNMKFRHLHRGFYYLGTLLLILLIVSMASCSALSHNQERDLKGVRFQNPQKTQGYTNVNQHPNVVALCINGAGFATTTRSYDALTRVEVWDASKNGWCAR